MREQYGDRWLGFQGEELESWLRDAGFQVEEKKTMPVRMGLSLLLITA